MPKKDLKRDALDELDRIRREQGVSRKEFAGRLGVTPSAVTQTFSHYHSTVNLDSLQNYAAALGRTVRVEFDPFPVHRTPKGGGKLVPRRKRG